MSELFVNNPFIVGKYLSDEYFCDRVEETDFLRKQVQNGRNVALISPRRIGISCFLCRYICHDITRRTGIYSR